MLFVLSGLPPSTNQSLTVARGRLIHTSAARAFRQATELAIDIQLKDQLTANKALSAQLKAMENKELICALYFYSNWLTKAGTIRKSDLANLEKLLLDSLVSVMVKNNFSFFDDSQFFCLTLHKIQSDIDKTEITILIKN